jgi:hypothetical protein
MNKHTKKIFQICFGDITEVLMKISLNHLIAVLLIGLTAGSMSNAQVIKKAQVGFRFLENPVSAEVVGRGAVGVATTVFSGIRRLLVRMILRLI